MGRPRKDPKDRLTRTITARVSDDQFDWLVQRTEEGEFSAALRNTIDLAHLFETILLDPDPRARFEQVLKDSEAEQARQEYFDEFGVYPDDS
jgi:hypothetical protein